MKDILSESDAKMKLENDRQLENYLKKAYAI